MDKKLDCCVVRDLLPAYIEELTEEETTVQVREHLDGCEACRTLETDMRAQVPVEKVPKRALNFLKRFKRTRLIAAAVTLALTLWCIGWLYDAEFHYPNTEAGRMAAVEDYVTEAPDSTMNHDMKAGTPFRVIAWQEQNGKLYLFYGADNRDNVHGIVELTRGINGKYRTDSASMSPFPYTAGALSEHLDDNTVVIAGDNCREIYSVALRCTWRNEQENRTIEEELIYPVEDINFMWLLDQQEIQEQLGASTYVLTWGVRFLDQQGNDVTEQYRDISVSQDWAGGKGSAEQFLLYWYIGIVAVLGGILIRYFLRRD